MRISASMTTDIYLLLGTNMGDRMMLLQQALTEISRLVGPVIHLSSIYETAAWGNENQPSFLNQVAHVQTSLSPHILLEVTQSIETKLGRKRYIKWDARLIDIDILFYGNDVIDTPNLQIPHPHIAARKFTLIPLQEIAPTLVHPLLHKNISALLNQTTDTLAVYPYNTETYEQYKL